MTKALVIKSVGDPEIAGAIIDGITRNVIELDRGELEVVKDELTRLKVRSELRAYGDQKRLRMARQEMARKYSTKPVGRATGAFLGLYGLFCLWVATAYRQLAEWNRS